MSRAARDRAGAWRALLVFCSVASVVPLWVTRHLPFTDLPEHVATVATLRHWFDPAWPDAHIYALSSRGSPYLAYQAVGALLTCVVGDALLANRLVLTAIGLAIPWATREAVRAFGGDERVALLACSAFWCRSLMLGFLPFLAAVPVALLAMALLARQDQAPTALRWLTLAAASVLTFYLHLVPFLLVVITAVALQLVPGTARPDETATRRLAHAPARLSWLAPSSVCAAVWLMRAGGSDASMMGEGPVRFARTLELPLEFPAWSHGTWHSRVSPVLGTALWLLVLSLAIHRREPEQGGVRGLVMRWVPFACATLLFALLPFGVGVTAMLNVRVAIFFLPLILIVLRPDRRRLTAALLLAAALVTCGVSAHAAVMVRAADRSEMAGFDDLLARTIPGRRLLSLPFERGSAYTDLSPWIHAGAYYRLRGGGVASTSFAEVPHWPIQFRPESHPPAAHSWLLESKPCAYRNAEDGAYYDYVLVRGAVDPFDPPPPGPQFVRVGRALDWSLYERTDAPGRISDAEDPGPCKRAPSLPAP